MQKYERLVQEDLSVGVNRVWVQAPARGKLRATQLGLHTFARGQQAYESDWAPGNIAAGGKASTTVTVPDVETGDIILASHSELLTNDLRITGHASAADTVTVVIHNPGTVAVTVWDGTARVIAFAFPSASVAPAFSPSFVWSQSPEDSSVLFTPNDDGLNVLTIDMDYGEGAGYQLDVGTGPLSNVYGGNGQDAAYVVLRRVNAVEGTFVITGHMTTNWAAGQSGSSE